MESILKIFCKAPVPGAVKSRLVPALGGDRAAALHALLAERTLAAGCDAGYDRVELWCAPDDRHPFFGDLHHRFGIELRVQRGADLGARMHRAFEDDGAVQVLIGSDCPDFGAEMLATARRRLAADRVDAVLGPANDGGYVLIGLRRPQAGVFCGMPWGGPGVMSLTRQRLREAGLCWRELETVRDVDRPADLRWLAAMPGFEGFRGSDHEMQERTGRGAPDAAGGVSDPGGA